jgi:hypothetical protein
MHAVDQTTGLFTEPPAVMDQISEQTGKWGWVSAVGEHKLMTQKLYDGVRKQLDALQLNFNNLHDALIGTGGQLGRSRNIDNSNLRQRYSDLEREFSNERIINYQLSNRVIVTRREGRRLQVVPVRPTFNDGQPDDDEAADDPADDPPSPCRDHQHRHCLRGSDCIYAH